MSLSSRDKAIIWHPFTQHQTAAEVIPISHGKGAYVYDDSGKAYLDLISSWWVNLHGHAHPSIAERIYEQAKKLEHVIFAGFTHEPAVALCEKLQTILPLSLNRFFFSDNGSTAVEVALKMTYQYWRNKKESQRTLFLSFDGAYHGDTFGAMSVGKKSGFHTAFDDLLFQVLTVPYAETWIDDPDLVEKENYALAILDQHLEKSADRIAAFIAEPLIQGAAGMRQCRPEFLRQIVDRVRSHGILVIFDEIMTGFGRTGTTFALEQVDRSPDFLCVSKGITGGFLPLALTITTDTIYQAFLSDQWDKAFAHGHSYTANPLACAAAVASFDLLRSDDCQTRISEINKVHRQGLKSINAIEKTRIQGTIAAFDIPEVATPTLRQQFLEQGLLIRPLGKTIYLLPPYCVTNVELEQSYLKIKTLLTD
jgi:adenosylmethionine-8-amino-7-oxononanoate aminotransferase